MKQQRTLYYEPRKRMTLIGTGMANTRKKAKKRSDDVIATLKASGPSAGKRVNGEPQVTKDIQIEGEESPSVR